MPKQYYQSIVEKIESLREPKKRQSLFDFENQIKFMEREKEYFEKWLSTIKRSIKDTDDNTVTLGTGAANFLRQHLKIAIIRERNDIPCQTLPSDDELAAIILTCIPGYLLRHTSTRIIKIFAETFVEIPTNVDGSKDFANAKEDVKVNPNDVSTWPKGYPTAHTRAIKENIDPPYPSMTFHDQIELWPVNGYTNNGMIALVYSLYCLFHEFGHTIIRPVASCDNEKELAEIVGKVAPEQHSLFSLPLNQLLGKWLEICEEEILPVSWYSGYYAPDILDQFSRGESSDFARAIGEEFAECFAWYLMDLTMDPWGETCWFSKLDLGNHGNTPSKKWQLMKLLFEGMFIDDV